MTIGSELRSILASFFPTPHPHPKKLLNTLAIIIHGFAYTWGVTCLLCYLACLLLSKVPVLADSVK